MPSGTCAPTISRASSGEAPACPRINSWFGAGSTRHGPYWPHEAKGIMAVIEAKYLARLASGDSSIDTVPTTHRDYGSLKLQ